MPRDASVPAQMLKGHSLSGRILSHKFSAGATREPICGQQTSRRSLQRPVSLAYKVGYVQGNVAVPLEERALSHRCLVFAPQYARYPLSFLRTQITMHLLLELHAIPSLAVSSLGDQAQPRGMHVHWQGSDNPSAGITLGLISRI